MKTDKLKEYAQRTPFRPFSINLVDGQEIHINTAHDLVFSPPSYKYELLIAFTEDGRMHFFEDSAIASITE